MKRSGMQRWFRFSRRTDDELTADLRDEFTFHLDMRTEALRRLGLPEAEARAQAAREFGEARTESSDCLAHDRRVERRRWHARLADEAWQDLRLGLRLLVRSPGLAVAAVLTIGLTIGGSTAVFGVANSLLFKPLPVDSPETLARVRAGQGQVAFASYRDLAERSQVFAALVAHRQLVAGLELGAAPVRLRGEQTTGNYFTALGVAPANGRVFSPADASALLVVLSDSCWRVHFGADPSVIGRRLLLNGRSYEVIGVMPPRFRGVAPAGVLLDFWIPLDEAAADPVLRDRELARFEMFGRLAPGIGREQAAAALRVAGAQIRREYPGVPETFAEMEVLAVDGLAGFRGMGDLIAPVLGFLLVTWIVAGLALLNGCANIGGLLIGRTVARRREIAVRLALGAGRRRLVRQLLMESLVLALAGGALGVLVAISLTATVNPLLSRLPEPLAFDLDLDRRVLAYAVAVATLTAFVFGLAPARRAARFDLVSSLRDDAAGSAVPQRLRRRLVVAQVAVCTALLVWSGLFLRSLGHLTTIDPGFDPDGVVLARVELDERTHDRAAGEQLVLDLERALEGSTEVLSAGIATVVPLSLENEEFDVLVDGSASPSPPVRVMANRLTPGWFDTVRIPVLAGRDFTDGDRQGAPAVVIVNETLARRWSGGALGQRLIVPDRAGGCPAEVVGVVRDSKYWTLGETPRPTVYLPFRQAYARWMTLHVRTSAPGATTTAIARELRRLAPDVYVGITPMRRTVALAVTPARIGAAVTGAFALLAMLLAALGVHGLVAFSVAQRTRELGVRRALGARTTDVVRLIAGEQMGLATAGLLVGLTIGVLGALALRGFIAGVTPFDPGTLAATLALVGGVAAAAAAVATLRAVLVSPAAILRDV